MINSLLLHCVMVVAIVFNSIVKCAKGPLIYEYREVFYLPDTLCLSGVFMFESSGLSNSSFTLLKSMPRNHNGVFTNCRASSSGYGFCVLDQQNVSINGEHEFRLVEKTADGQKLVSPVFSVNLDLEKTRYKPLKYLHAVTLNGNTSSLVYLIWAEQIPPKECYYSFKYNLRRYYYRGCGYRCDIDKEKIVTEKLTNIPKMKQWSQCFTKIKQTSNEIQDTYQVYYELFYEYHSNKTKLIDLLDLIPKTQCYKKNNQFTIEWKAAINNTESAEILQIPYTHYKLTIMEDANITEVILPLNASNYVINTALTPCSSSISFFLDACILTDCTGQSIGCYPCGGNPNDSKEPHTGEVQVSLDFWYMLLVIVPVLAFLLFYYNKRRLLHTENEPPIQPNVICNKPDEINKIQERPLPVPKYPRSHLYDSLDIDFKLNKCDPS